MSTKSIQQSRKADRLRRKEISAAYLFLAPSLICLSIFVFYPMIYAFVVSLHQWDALSDMKFIGIENYISLLHDKEWYTTLLRTFMYVLMYVPLLFIMSLLLALIVKHIPIFSGLFRTVYFFPIVLSSVVTGLLWKLMLDEKMGLVNILIKSFGLPAVPWLSSIKIALISTVLVHVWIQMGYYMVIFLAGLQDIPKDYYEAAKLDGAGGWQTFCHITFPCLTNTSVFVLIISVINSFQAFDQIKVMTGGGPANSTKLAVQYIYETSFKLFDMGRASAMSFVLFLIIIIFTVIQLKFVKVNKE